MASCSRGDPLPRVLCPNHPDAILVEDYRAGDMICPECGLVVVMEGKKKRKANSEGRLFNEEWGIKYFFVQASNKALCLICKATVAALKEYNLRRHYETKHSSSYSQFIGTQRSEKLKSLQGILCSQRAVFTKKKTENEALTRASYKVAYVLVKRGKPFSDGDFIKECMMEVVGELCPEKANLFKIVCLAPNTVARRIGDLGSNILQQIVDKARSFCWYSLTLAEPTDVCDTSQLLVFIRGVDSEFNVTQELASIHRMQSTVTGEDIFNKLQKTMSEYNLKWNQLQCVTIDGGKNISGAKNGLVGQITKAVEVGGFSKPMFLHCINHQQALCGKYVDMSCVLKPVASVVNLIRSHGLNHRQFGAFLEEIDSEFVDLPYYTAVRWLSCAKVLLRFFQLRKDIDSFLIEKNHPQPLLSDAEWLWKLAFFADVTSHMNQLNLRLQGEKNLICDFFAHVKAFRAKLVLLEGQVKVCNLAHFPCCEEFHEESEEEFPSSFANDVILGLKIQFQEQFSDLDAKANYIRLFQNPFDCKVENLPSQFQMEIIDLQADDGLKDKYKEGNLIEFYKFLKPEQFPNLKQLACRFVSIFGTTYFCEQTFSRMKYVKSKYRANLSDEHLKSILLIGSSNLDPQFNDILKSKKQFHPSH